MNAPTSNQAKAQGTGQVRRPDGTVKTDHVLKVPAPQPTEVKPK